MPDFTLYLANKNYSSWSLRAWLALKLTQVPFEEVIVPLKEPQTRSTILGLSPSGKLPALRHGDFTVWESLAICEYLAELYPAANLWPAAVEARACARAVSAEMHAGFLPLRRHFPMNLRSVFPNREPTPEVQADVNRITSLWRDCRKRFGGAEPFLFGSFTAADAMFAPVVGRFRTYKVELDEVSAAYADAVWAHPLMQEWLVASRNEPMVIEEYEF